MRFLIIAVVCFIYFPLFSQGIRINEIMSSNTSSFSDNDGDFSDWIELYNDGITEVNLFGYGLSDKDDNPYKWVFPNVVIPGEGYLLVWASGKNLTDSAKNLHTNFSIKSSGETVLLHNPVDNKIIDRVNIPTLPIGVSYGRKGIEASDMFFFSAPTPGSLNDSPGYEKLLPDLVFSHVGGIFDEPFNLNISTLDSSVSIIYTLDGSIPDAENLSGTIYYYKNSYPSGSLLTSTFKTNLYEEPISIKDRSLESDSLTRKSSTFHLNPPYFPSVPVNKGTVVRARAFKKGSLPGDVITHTYFFNSNFKYTLPVVNMTVQANLLFDYYKGIYTAGEIFDNWRVSNPTAALDGGSSANYTIDIENKAHIEVIDKKQIVLSQDVGFKIHGGYNRYHPAKSLRIYARAEYGASRMDHAFFPDEMFKSYKRIIFRNAGNDWGYTLFRDAAIQSIMSHLKFETQAYHPSILFINGEYWGIHGITERYDKHYFARKYGIDPDNIDILSGNMGIEEGDASHYKETIEYIEKNGLKDSQHFEYIKTRIDVENLIDYQLAEIFSGNVDWPGNNIKYWRAKNNYSRFSEPEKDGRWRWLMYDTDLSFGAFSRSVAEDNLSAATNPAGPSYPNPPWATFLLRKLLENDSFKIMFINRFIDQLNSALRPEITKQKIIRIKELLAPEIQEHISRWKSPGSFAWWESHINVLLAYTFARPGHQREHIRKYFQLGNDFLLKVNVSDTTHGYVKVNNLELKIETEGLPSNIYPWSGTYFSDIPIQIEAIPFSGYRFIKWKGISDSLSAKINISSSDTLLVEAIFEKKPVASLIHYWNFNDSMLLNKVSYTVNGGNLEVLSVQSESEYVIGTGNGFTGQNTQLSDSSGTHLRINKPIGTTLLFSLPTAGFSDLVLEYETKRSDKGPGAQIVEYSLDGIVYKEKKVFNIPSNDVILNFIDFSDTKDVDNSNDFSVRITFQEGSGGIDGNNRIDNVTLKGTPISILNTKENEKPFEICNFPNPFFNETNIQIYLPRTSPVSFILIDINGNKVYENNFEEVQSGKHNIKINTSDFFPGIYCLIFRTNENQFLHKIVKY